ncbi:MAG: hypothetical protein PHX64_01475 [Candidatus Omnitrophica bacterium]|nr:hypothetical protein [Candidatus Omnitrophota bacterium]MDD5310409.1 hypothetical protein [Candidatus Omnitrophota bacterium]MDD5546747.1 hypothetical protein [Candidatus Omnitrophota bacterium]
MGHKKGFILIVAYSVVAVILILIAAYVARSVAEMRTAQREKDSLAALAAAETGIDYGFAWLKAQPTPPAGTAPIFNPVITGVPKPALTTGTYSVTVVPNASNPTNWPKKYEIVSVGTSGDSTRTVYYEVQRDTFAKNIWFTNTESYGPLDVWFVTVDSLDGPVHTNDSFNISGDPQFPDLIDLHPTQHHGPSINYMHPGDDNPYFAQPVDFNADTIEMPDHDDTEPLRNAAASGGRVFTGNTTITLNANGTMNVTNATGGYNNTNMPVPANGAIYVQNKLDRWGHISEYGYAKVSGTLNGRLSIGTNDDIIITGNVQYNINPQTNPNSTDTLGLIAEGDVVIKQSACPTNGNLTIQAAVMAMADSFYLEDWTSSMKGALNIYGGITQNQRGPVGSFNITTSTKASGFSKNYVYDRRLRDAPPPYFPDTKKYIGVAWREQ